MLPAAEVACDGDEKTFPTLWCSHKIMFSWITVIHMPFHVSMTEIFIVLFGFGKCRPKFTSKIFGVILLRNYLSENKYVWTQICRVWQGLSDDKMILSISYIALEKMRKKAKCFEKY